MPSRRTSLKLATVVVTVVLAGCGGSSGVSAGSYVKSVCTAIGSFEKDVQNRSSALNISGLTKATEGKQALQGFMSSAVADAQRAVTGLKAAGTPNVSNGKAIAAAIEKAFSELKAALAQAQAQTNALPTNSPAAFKTAAAALGSTIRSSFGTIGSSLSSFKSPALETAAKRTPACRTVG